MVFKKECITESILSTSEDFYHLSELKYHLENSRLALNELSYHLKKSLYHASLMDEHKEVSNVI